MPAKHPSRCGTTLGTPHERPGTSRAVNPATTTTTTTVVCWYSCVLLILLPTGHDGFAAWSRPPCHLPRVSWSSAKPSRWSVTTPPVVSNRAVAAPRQDGTRTRPTTIPAAAAFRMTATGGDAAALAPLYITVGPPCAGKTTWLRSSLVSVASSASTTANTRATTPSPAKNVVDVCLDDQPGVYRALPLDCFLTNPNRTANATTTTTTTTANHETTILHQVWYGTSVRERVASQTELRLVLQRLAGQLSAADFDTKAMAALSGPVLAREALVRAVERAMLPQNGHGKDGTTATTMMNNNNNNATDTAAVALSLPSTIDLFCVQALFRPSTHGNSTGSGLDRAHAQLRAVPTATPIAWGNTNTKATDYTVALGLAHEQGRPVHFVVYQANSNNETSSSFELQSNGFDDLLDRSLRRLIATGRYIPAGVVLDMTQRTNELLRSAANATTTSSHKRSSSDTDHALARDRGLARLCGYGMHENRTVYQLPSFQSLQQQQQQQSSSSRHSAKRTYSDRSGRQYSNANQQHRNRPPPQRQNYWNGPPGRHPPPHQQYPQQQQRGHAGPTTENHNRYRDRNGRDGGPNPRPFPSQQQQRSQHGSLHTSQQRPRDHDTRELGHRRHGGGSNNHPHLHNNRTRGNDNDTSAGDASWNTVGRRRGRR